MSNMSNIVMFTSNGKILLLSDFSAGGFSNIVI